MNPEITIRYNGLFDIAIGRSRRETQWKNQQMTWADFLRQIGQTHRTPESYSQYMAEKKSRQDEIKDIGGFVGGYVNNGRRKAENIAHRQLITLDIDFSKGGLWQEYRRRYAHAAALYSTHKHSPHNPRLRLILPLDRRVTPDEYQAIARQLAASLDINLFDDTTFQPERLMYWPSTAKDGEYLFEYQDGPWLSADEMLATYQDWHDTTRWPLSERAAKVVLREIKKQGDPLEKPGIVGAFCRAYTLHQAIETFLAEVYTPCLIADRYTYKEGSTAAGLVVYDDKYAYSHHSTDPASMKLCNAFDLVRIHLYGLQDEDAKEGTPGNRLPSYKAMTHLATADTQTRKRIGAERIGTTENTDWLAKMDIDPKGNYRSTTQNIRLILDNDPALKDAFAKNDFEKREIATRHLPWRKIDPANHYLCDVDDAGLRHYLESTYAITGLQKVKDALDLTVEKNAFHPVKDYLQALQWDGRERVATLLTDYLGAENTPYVQAVSRKTLAAAVARIFRPGTKFDHVLVLVGKQGIGKSTFIKKLGKSWYSDSFGTVQGKEAFEQIQGVWLVEMGELAGLKRAEMETIKHFISKQEDRYRVAYGRRTENFPRQCVFLGTTNNKDFLRDPTGNRRFWPVNTEERAPEKNLFTDLDDYQTDQIWAEAVALYRAGETLYLNKDIERMANFKQNEHSQRDERSGIIQNYLDTPLPANWEEMDLYTRRNFIQTGELARQGVVQRNRVCVAEIWCELFGRAQADMNRYNTKDLHDIMKTMEGWQEAVITKSRCGIYGVQKIYIRTNSWQQNQ